MPRIDGCVNFGRALFACVFAPQPKFALGSLPRVSRWLLDLLLPDHCVLCKRAASSGGYCPDCSAALARHDKQCRLCGVPIVVEGVCGSCQHSPPDIVETIAPFEYIFSVRDDVHQLKYHGKLACGRDLGMLLARELRGRASSLPDVLVPVPLHWKRRFRRGFNQSLEIARPVSRELGIPIRTDLIERCIHTPPQVGLPLAMRRRNMRGVFRCTGNRMPGTAAIIDDVITSGSTTLEAARCLRSAGVARVAVWALARL